MKDNRKIEEIIIINKNTRIIKKGCWYYAQYKKWFNWYNFPEYEYQWCMDYEKIATYFPLKSTKKEEVIKQIKRVKIYTKDTMKNKTRNKNINYSNFNEMVDSKIGDEVYIILESWGCNGEHYKCCLYGKIREICPDTQYRIVEWEKYTSQNRDR